MARLEDASNEERPVRKAPPGKEPKWQSLVEVIKGLAPDDTRKLVPEGGETLRALKVQVSKAAKAASREDEIESAANHKGELLFWVRTEPRQRRVRAEGEAISGGQRGRRRRSGSDEASLEETVATATE